MAQQQTLTDATTKALEQSINIAKENGHPTVEPLH
jgi:hypothetical protein